MKLVGFISYVSSINNGSTVLSSKNPHSSVIY